MILVDTTVWIDFFKNNMTTQVAKLEDSIKNSEDICICGVILTEILQGIQAKNQYLKTKSYLENLVFLPMNYSTFVTSADIFRYLRRRGITIRKPIDCMIAAVSVENKVPLLHNDRDFDHIEIYKGFKTIPLE
jgi:predicted nucleic acid-binding protein